MNAVSAKRILHETMQEKLKKSWVSNFAKKIKKKLTPSPPTKKLFVLRIKHVESACAKS